ncbi:MAG: glutathione S-transferase family protein [Pseudomonadota bacterium]
MTDLILIGYGPSVYARAVRLALGAADLHFDWQEENPFAAPNPAHPFGRVPVLRQGPVTLYETAAILTYLDACFPRTEIPDPLTQARIAQVASIADTYAYWPLVRQVFVQGVAKGPGATPDTVALAEGMAKAPRILAALDDIAAEGTVLSQDSQTRADWHLFPMVDLFARHGPAAQMLTDFPHLNRWLMHLRAHPVVRRTPADHRQTKGASNV